MSPGVATQLGCRLRDLLRHCCCQLRPNATASPSLGLREYRNSLLHPTLRLFQPSRQIVTVGWCAYVRKRAAGGEVTDVPATAGEAVLAL